MSSGKGVKYWLLRIANHDDQSSFRYLFDYFYPKVLNYSLYFLESKSAADDVISKVFMAIWKNRVRVSKVEKFEAYLFRAVKNKCLNYLRDSNSLQFEELDNEKIHLTKSVASPESDLINQELGALIFKALDALPPRCRCVFELVKIEGFKYKEVAELLGISINTVENQMGKAMIRLRSELDQHSFLK